MNKNFEKQQSPGICENISSALGRWRCSRFIALFKGQGSRQMRNFPFGFSTIKRPFAQSVGFLIGSIMSRSTIRLSSFSSFGLSACGTLRTGVTTGFTLPFTSIWWVIFKVPISPKQSWNFEKNVSLFVSILQILFISCKCSLVFNPRIGTESESAIINEPLKELFLWSRVNEHLPTTRIFEPLYADNITFTGWRSGLRYIFSKLSTGITLHWAPVSFL